MLLFERDTPVLRLRLPTLPLPEVPSPSPFALSAPLMFRSAAVFLFENGFHRYSSDVNHVVLCIVEHRIFKDKEHRLMEILGVVTTPVSMLVLMVLKSIDSSAFG